MDVNVISYVALTQAFTPFLLSKSTPTSFIFTSSCVAKLHDYMGIEKGRGMGMPVKEVLETGSDEVLGGGVGPTEVFRDLNDKRRQIFDELVPMLRDV
ncbi:Glucose/ribitol dehydrogenase [Penicillium solitum]|uniref:Glucose/ribitol dehydrogenase n=1 Tax=Penicillium solitum TaxID=60172 RepID=UPI0032C3F03F|nr:Glucose/ribitol dehydrogenase [Penicillium solitum]